MIKINLDWVNNIYEKYISFDDENIVKTIRRLFIIYNSQLRMLIRKKFSHWKIKALAVLKNEDNHISNDLKRIIHLEKNDNLMNNLDEYQEEVEKEYKKQHNSYKNPFDIKQNNYNHNQIQENKINIIKNDKNINLEDSKKNINVYNYPNEEGKVKIKNYSNNNDNNYLNVPMNNKPNTTRNKENSKKPKYIFDSESSSKKEIKNNQYSSLFSLNQKHLNENTPELLPKKIYEKLHNVKIKFIIVQDNFFIDLISLNFF